MDNAVILQSIYDALEKDPDNVHCHERLVEIWDAQGDKATASSIATHILTLDRQNQLAMKYLKGTPFASSGSDSDTMATAPSGKGKSRATIHSSKPRSRARPTKSTFYPETRIFYKDYNTAEKTLREGLKDLLEEAKLLHTEISALDDSARFRSDEDNEVLFNLRSISEGRVHAAVPLGNPPSVREIAEEVTVASSTEEATALIISDFEAVIQWFHTKQVSNPPKSSSAISSTASPWSSYNSKAKTGSSSTHKSTSKSKNTKDSITSDLRSRLISRRTLLLAYLPTKLAPAVNDAFASIERTHLDRKYTNTETMLGDSVSDIPADKFIVTEDNYAWDMSELVQAITANSGVMRNPLTKTMFTPQDIRRILAHPDGAALKPIRDRQESFRTGLSSTHPNTIRKIAELGKIMLEDQTEDAAPSRKSIDEFLGYAATLPDKEQEALDKLKIPAKDSHTGQAYDYTVGEAVNDAKSNVTCGHKVGDFLKQAAEYLGRQRKGGF